MGVEGIEPPTARASVITKFFKFKSLIRLMNKEIKLKINENFAELVGALIGDGYIYKNNRKYQIGFVGNIVTDKAYFQYLRAIILKEWKKEAKIKVRERGLRMVIDSKEVCNFLINELKIPYGKEKRKKVLIPTNFLIDWTLTKKVIRGIFDTDGTVFAVKKPRIDKYPSIELTTISKKLAEQVRSILKSQGFRVSKIWNFKQKSGNLGYRFGLNGMENLKQLVKIIGFSNPYKLERAISYLNN